MKKTRRIIPLFVVAVIIFCQLISAVSAEESTASRNNEMAFSIPANTFCDQSQKVELSLNLTNMGSTAATIKLDLLKADGTPFVTPGSSYNGINSTIIPGGSISVNSLVSAFYHQTFGGLAINCAERPYAGKLTVTSADKATIVASGYVSGSLGNTTIIINGGQPWVVSGEVTSPTPTPTPTPINPPVDNCSITALQGLIHAMTSDEDTYGIASSSSYDPTYDARPYKAFDNACNQFETANLQKTGWLQYEFKSAKTVNKYSILMKQGDPAISLAQSPNTWVFEAYDGQKWITLDTQTNVTSWIQSAAKEYTFNNSTAYNKYRLNISQNNGGNLINITELGMFGY